MTASVLILRQTLVEGLDQYKALGYSGLTVGTAIVYRQADQPARLAIVKVERACRREGIGRALMQRIVSDNVATGMVGVIDPLEKSLSREALAKFYRKCGATITTRGRCTWAARP